METGRQIEAGKIPGRQNPPNATRARLPQATLSFTGLQGLGGASSRSHEPPRVANFEDRLKSIITSVLNEDQQNRSKQQLQMQLQAQQLGEPDRKRLAMGQNVNAPDYTQVYEFGYH